MILKIVLFSSIISVVVNDVSSAAFSKVFVQSGSEALPVEYIQYGVPTLSLTSPQIGQISTGQVVSVPSAPGLVAPCAIPCIYPGQVVSAVAPTAPKTATYKSSVPVIIQNEEETPSYEYSYVVYDENTGDHKSQFEQSDGSTVQGKYSFLQPDGLVREVTYVADNAKGFNAIVKHFLPEKEQKKKETKEKSNQEPPCPEVKNDIPEVSEGKHETPGEETYQKLSKLTVDLEKNLYNPKNGEIESNNEVNSIKESNGNKLKEEPVEKISTNVSTQKEPETATPKGLVSEALTEDIPRPQTEQSLIETQQSNKLPKALETVDSPAEDKKFSIIEINKGEPNDNTEIAVLNTATATQLGLEGTEILGPFNNIIKCIQIAGNDGSNQNLKSESPLTYIILNKSC